MRPLEVPEAIESLEWFESVVLGKARPKDSILTVAGFLRAALRLAVRLRDQIGLVVGSKDFMRRLRVSTQIDWLGASEAEKARAVAEVQKLIQGLPSAILPGVKVVLKEEGKTIVTDTKRAVKAKHKQLKISPVFGQKDERAVEALATTASVFFSEEYAKRAENFRERAHRTITNGLEQGFDRRTIAADLRAEFDEAVIPEAYLETVAAHHVARARSFSALASYAEAEVEEFTWLSILDSRCTDLCRDLNVRTFSVQNALAAFDKLEDAKSLEDVKRVSPLLPADATAEEFIAAGGFAPPAHFRCRSSLAAKF